MLTKNSVRKTCSLDLTSLSVASTIHDVEQYFFFFCVKTKNILRTFMNTGLTRYR